MVIEQQKQSGNSGLIYQLLHKPAYSTKEKREKAFSAGCDEFVSKPIDDDILAEIVNKYAVTK